MVKFLIALAELFSSFSAKLHDMSNDIEEPEAPSIDIHDHKRDIIDIVQRAINRGNIELGDNNVSTDDIDGLEEYVMGCIPDPEEAIGRILRFRQLRDVVLDYATMYGHHRGISLTRETALLNQYMLDRITAWTNEQTHGEPDKTVLVIDTENNSSIKI